MAFNGFLAAASGSSTGLLVSSSYTWAKLNGASGGLNGLLEALVAKQVATADPTAAPTLSANVNAASTLPTATYYVKVTELNAFGETKPSPLSSGQAITSGTNNLRVTFQTLKTGNFARNVYVGTQSDGSDLKLAATGQTGATCDISAPLPSNSYAVRPPTVNSTAPSYTDANGVGRNTALQLIRGVEKGNAQDIWRKAERVVTNFLSNRPVKFDAELASLRQCAAATAMLLQALLEVGTLIDANPGTITASQDPIGNAPGVRTQP